MFLLPHQKHYHYYNIGVALLSRPIEGTHIANVHNSFLSGAKTEWVSRHNIHDRRGVNVA